MQPPLPLDDPIYRPNTIAERTGAHIGTIRNAIRRGEMQTVRLGKRAIGVRASEVGRWLDNLQKQAPAPKPILPRQRRPKLGSSPLREAAE
jgi:excisionase family DNA binding protein